MNKTKELKIGAVIAYITIAIKIVSGLLYTPWIVEQIGDSDYGLYTLANSLINLFLFDFGLSAATSRFVSKYLAEGRQDKVNRILGVIYKLYLIIDAVIFVILFVLSFFLEQIYSNLTSVEIQRFRVVFIISGAFALINFPCVTFTGILNSYEKFIALKVADALYRILTVVITVVALVCNGGLYTLVCVQVLVGLLVLAFKFYIIKRKTPLKVDFSYKEKGIFRELFQFSLWITVSTLSQRLIIGITPSILGMVSGSVAIAAFGIISVLENYIHMITTALNGMFMPKISRIFTQENATEKLNNLIVRVGRFQFILNGLITTGFLLLGREFILLWLDETYLVAYYGLLLVTVPNLFYYPMQIANTALVIKNHVKIQAITNLIVGVINVALSFVLSARYGVFGACIAIFVAYMLRNIGYFAAYYKILNLNIKKVVKECYVSLGIPMLITIALGGGLNVVLSELNWLMFAVKVVIVAVLYLLLTLFIGLNRQERKAITTAIAAILKRGKS
ncbi:MAG: hypothetical protein E7553_02920 [Ruminococcaceae bacterium]|nr:hypothetical protein [Oscillospiraceae bacterium]